MCAWLVRLAPKSVGLVGLGFEILAVSVSKLFNVTKFTTAFGFGRAQLWRLANPSRPIGYDLIMRSIVKSVKTSPCQSHDWWSALFPPKVGTPELRLIL